MSWPTFKLLSMKTIMVVLPWPTWNLEELHPVPNIMLSRHTGFVHTWITVCAHRESILLCRRLTFWQNPFQDKSLKRYDYYYVAGNPTTRTSVEPLFLISIKFLYFVRDGVSGEWVWERPGAIYVTRTLYIGCYMWIELNTEAWIECYVESVIKYAHKSVST